MKSESKFHSLDINKLVTAASLLLLMLLGFFHPINAWTQDLGRHILTGNIILTTYNVPKVNLFAFTYPDFPVINTHWLSEVVFAVIYNAFSTPGLFILMLLLVGLAGILQVVSVYKQMSLLALGISGILYIRILFERTDLRPELFSFLFLSLVITLLYRHRSKPTKLILFLIPLQFLWVNMHIYFAIGLVVQGIFLLDSIYLNRKHLRTSQVTLLCMSFAGSILATLLNPNGLQGALYPLFVFNNYGYTIEENQTVFLLESLGFHKPSFPFLKVAVVLLFLSLTVSWRKTRPVDWLLSVCFTILAFSAVRNMPLFVFATFIPFSLFLTSLLNKGAGLLKPYQVLLTYKTPLLLTTLSLLLLWQALAISNLFPLGYGVTAGASKAVDFMKREQITGPLFNNFDIGGYLIARRYPTERVFVDGRPEAYPASFFSGVYKPMQENPALFDKVVATYAIDTIFFPHTDQTPWGITFLQWIIKHPDWKIVYVDDYVIILLKQTAENEAAIQKFAMNPEQLRITKSENTAEANLRIVAFLAKVNLLPQTVPYLHEIIRIKPDYCPALGMLTEIAYEQQDPASLIYNQRYSQSCL